MEQSDQQSNSQSIQEVSSESSIKQQIIQSTPPPYSGTSPGVHKHPSYIIATIVIVAAFVLIYVGLSQRQLFTTGTAPVSGNSNTAVNIGASANTSSGANATVQNTVFLKSYGFNQNLTYVTFYPSLIYDQGPSCSGTATTKIVYQLRSNASQQTNLSGLNEKLPINEYASTYEINPYYAEVYSQMINRTGLCSQTLNGMAFLLNNSQHTYYTLSTGNYTLHIYYMHNFTNNAFNLMNYGYAGSKPDIYWYLATTVYKGTGLQFGVWGFANEVNQTLLTNQSETFVNSYVSFTK